MNDPSPGLSTEDSVSQMEETRTSSGEAGGCDFLLSPWFGPGQRVTSTVDRGPTGWSARPSSAARSGSARDAGGDSIQAAVAEGEGAAVASSPPPTGKTAVNHPLAPWRRQLI